MDVSACRSAGSGTITAHTNEIKAAGRGHVEGLQKDKGRFHKTQLQEVRPHGGWRTYELFGSLRLGDGQWLGLGLWCQIDSDQTLA